MADDSRRAESARDNPSLRSANLRIAVSAAIKHYDLTATAFGRRAANDPGLVFGMRKGRELRPKTAQRIRAFIAALATEASHV